MRSNILHYCLSPSAAQALLQALEKTCPCPIILLLVCFCYARLSYPANSKTLRDARTLKGCVTLQAKIWNKVRKQQQLAREKKKKIDKHPPHSIPVIVRSVTLSGKASRKHFRKPLADFWSRRLVHGIVSTRVILSRATCVCVCARVYIYIYAVYHRKKQTVFPPNP